MIKHYRGISEKIRFCNICNERSEGELKISGVKLFLRYVDEIRRTVKGDLSVGLQAANQLHPHLKQPFTLEAPTENNDLTFLDINLNVDGTKKIKCG